MSAAPLYEVSSTGEVRNSKTGRVLTPFKAKHGGYPSVKLWHEGKHITTTIHKLVMQAFVGERPEGMQVRHLDGDPANNDITNLQYGTPSENRKDSVRHGTHKWARKTHCPAGHEYDEANTYLTSDGRRVCRECQRRHGREWARRKRAKAS